jgi:hypothetical protein
MTMNKKTDRTTKTTPGTYFARLFNVDTEQFQLQAQKPRVHKDSEYLNRPYELSDLMRQANNAGVWPHQYYRHRLPF